MYRERERCTVDATNDIVSTGGLTSGEYNPNLEFTICLKGRHVRRHKRGRRLPEEIREKLGDLICATKNSSHDRPRVAEHARQEKKVNEH